MSESNARETHFGLCLPAYENKRFWKAASQLSDLKADNCLCFDSNWFQTNETEMAVTQMLFGYYLTSLDASIIQKVQASYLGAPLVTISQDPDVQSIRTRFMFVDMGFSNAREPGNTQYELQGLQAASKADRIQLRTDNTFYLVYRVVQGSARTQYEHQVISMLRVFWVLPFLMRMILQRTEPEYPIEPLLAPCEELIRILSAELNRPKEKLGLTLEWVYLFLKDSGYIDKLCAQADEIETKRSQLLIDRLLKGTESAELQAAYQHEKELQEKIANLTRQLAVCSKALRLEKRNIAGLLTCESNEDEKAKELRQFLEKMSDVFWFNAPDLESPNSKVIDFRVYTLLEDVDTDLLRRFRQASAHSTSPPWSRCEAQFFAELLNSSRYKLRVFGTWRYDCDTRTFAPEILSGQSESLTDLIRPGYVSNWHIVHYGCVSGYLATLSQYASQGDVIGCLYTALKATKGINVADSVVSANWISRLKDIPRSCACIYDKETQTCITWGEAQEIYNKEGHL